MGMQCHFSKSELPDTAVILTDSDGMGALIKLYDEELYAFKINDSFWFDVGSRTYDQMLKLKTLIGWRVCFTCS